MPEVVSREEMPDRGVTAPPWPELIEAGGRRMTGQLVGVTAPPRPELIEAGGRSVARINLGRNQSRREEGAWPDELSR